MPELPEVETVKLGLRELIIGKKIESIWHDWPNSFPNNTADVKKYLTGATILSINRRAKMLIFRLSSSYVLLVHLKMTGQLVFRGAGASFGAGHPSESLVGTLPDKSTRVTFKFSDKSKLFFNDQRKFGWIKLLSFEQLDKLNFYRLLGPEPLSPEFKDTNFRERIQQRPNSSIKATLLDQTVVAGIGNIYADESLWASKIHPARAVKTLSTSKLNTLFKELQSILATSIKQGGSSDRNYVNVRGQKGSFLNFANVFRRQGMDCPRCQTVIIKLRVAGRGTHICPTCQIIKL
jgi:formamidopyrimidine-DNA glycosylase